MSDHAGPETHAVVQAGVGIFFQQDVGGFVVVKTIVKGGSAERDGTVQIGDRILSADDRSVAGESLPVLRSLILGPQGSAVKMKFARQSSHNGVQEFSVSLIRGTKEYFSEKDSFSRPQSLDSVGPFSFLGKTPGDRGDCGDGGGGGDGQYAFPGIFRRCRFAQQVTEFPLHTMQMRGLNHPRLLPRRPATTLHRHR